MNTVSIIGNITKQPEIRYLPNGTAVIQMSIAYNEKRKDSEKVSFFETVGYGKTAELCNQYLNKGAKVGITGQLEQQRWEKDGKNFSKVVIKIDRITFLSSKKETDEPKAEQDIL